MRIEFQWEAICSAIHHEGLHMHVLSAQLCSALHFFNMHVCLHTAV